MEVYRIAREKYSNNLFSSGSANRWNFDGQKVIYTGSSRSLTSLELLAHRSYIQPKESYRMMIISISAEHHLYNEIDIEKLPENWKSLAAYSELQQIGSDWYRSKSSLVLKVPSAIIPYEYNYILNTEHQEFDSKVMLIRTEDYFWDERLLE